MGYKIKAEIFNMETNYYAQKMKAAGLTREEEDSGEADILAKINKSVDITKISEKTFKDYENIKTKIHESKEKGDDKYKLIHEERLFSSSQNTFRIYLEYLVKDKDDEHHISEESSFN